MNEEKRIFNEECLQNLLTIFTAHTSQEILSFFHDDCYSDEFSVKSPRNREVR